jgi:hypothetical protein
VAGSELVGGAQDRFQRIAALIPDQLISGGVAKTMLAEEGFRPQPVVILYRVHTSGPGMLPGPDQEIAVTGAQSAFSALSSSKKLVS